MPEVHGEGPDKSAQGIALVVAHRFAEKLSKIGIIDKFISSSHYRRTW
jgi:hypothetical protein